MGFNAASFPDNILVTLGSKWKGVWGLSPAGTIVLQTESVLPLRHIYSEDGTSVPNGATNRMQVIMKMSATGEQPSDLAYQSVSAPFTSLAGTFGAVHSQREYQFYLGSSYTFKDVFNIGAPTRVDNFSPAVAYNLTGPASRAKPDIFSAMAEYIPPAESVDSCTPDNGPTKGGETVTIAGLGFGAVQLTGIASVNGVPLASYDSWADDKIVGVTGVGTAVGLGDVVVTPDGGSAITGADLFTYNASIHSISPVTGSAAGGTNVTLSGIGFGASQLLGIAKIGGVSLTSITTWNDTTIIGKSPAGTIGAQNVTVTPDGGSILTLTDGFTYTEVISSITDIDSITANGEYKTGNIINIQINFDNNVILANGRLKITLNTGEVAYAYPVTDVLFLTITYLIGDFALSFDLNVEALELIEGGNLKSETGNDIILTIPSGQNLADNKDLRIEGNDDAFTTTLPFAEAPRRLKRRNFWRWITDRFVVTPEVIRNNRIFRRNIS